jgi:hypothetical protein
MLNQHASPGPWQIHHLKVQNLTAELPTSIPEQPQMLIITDDQFQDLDYLQDYQQVYNSISVQLWKLR